MTSEEEMIPEKEMVSENAGDNNTGASDVGVVERRKESKDRRKEEWKDNRPRLDCARSIPWAWSPNGTPPISPASSAK